MRKWFWGIGLGLIFLLGIGLRLYHLTDVPHGFFGDEAAIGYNAYTIFHSGVDEYGKHFPLFFQSFGDYKDPVQIYFTVPFIALFGLSEFATRLPSVVWGIVTILGVYLVTTEIKKSRIAGLFGAFAAAVMPWLIHYNRAGFELNSYAALWTITVYCFLKAQNRKIFFYFCAFFLGLTLFSYQPAKLLVPLLLIGFFITYHHSILRHKIVVLQSSLLFLIFAIPMIVSFFDVAGIARFTAVSVFSGKLTSQEIVGRVISNYFDQLSPAFFLTGEPTFITRHFIHGLLPLLPVTFPFLVIGLFYILLTIRKASSQFLIWLLLLYPVAGAVVLEAPFTSRAVIGAPLFAVLIGIGVERAIHLGRHKIGKIAVGGAIAVLFMVNTVIFCQFYFTQYPLYSSDYWGWQYGAKSIMQYFLSHKSQYDDLAMAGDFNGAEIFLKFYDPTHTCTNCITAKPNDIFDSKRKQLFALTPDDMEKDTSFVYHPVGEIFYPDNTKAFLLVTVQKK